MRWITTSRAALVKDERNLDKFDRVFGHVFKGLETLDGTEIAEIPDEWLKRSRKNSSPRRKRSIDRGRLGQADGDAEAAPRGAEEAPRGRQEVDRHGRHLAVRRHGYNPEGIRIGQDKSRHGKAVKVWDKREYKNLDDSVELGTRNIKVALRRLRKFARTGAPDELDMDGTIKETANKGYLDLKLRPERRNTIKVLLFFDIGGSMDATSSSARSCSRRPRPSSSTWNSSTSTTASMRACGRTTAAATTRRSTTWDVLHKYGHDYKVIFVGDATMSPYEITYPGGSVEHWNEEAGAIWLDRVTQIYEQRGVAQSRRGETLGLQGSKSRYMAASRRSSQSRINATPAGFASRRVRKARSGSRKSESSVAVHAPAGGFRDCGRPDLPMPFIPDPIGPPTIGRTPCYKSII
jgi:uncharacterized protein with von Willebrand factor type A (vWA) domain